MPLRDTYLSSHRRFATSPHQPKCDERITTNQIFATSSIKTSDRQHPTTSQAPRDNMKRFCTILLYLIGCTSIVILGYSLLLHHFVGDQKSGQAAGVHLQSANTHPIERPRTSVNFEDQQEAVQVSETGANGGVLVDRYNDHEFKLRSVREKIDRLTFVGHNQDDAERAANEHSHPHHQQPHQNVTTQHVHIFYRAPVPWYTNEALGSSHNVRDGQDHASELSNTLTVHPLNSVFYPLLGVYSITTKVLDIHFRNIYEAGIQVIVVNWSPNQSLDLIKHMMNYAKKTYDSRLSIAIELAPYVGRTAQSIRADLQRLRDEFVWAHPAMYRVQVVSRAGDWLPMVYVQGACGIDSDQWADVLGAKRAGSVRRSAVDAIFIGEVSTKKDTSLIRRGFFNGFYTRSASNGATYSATWKNWDQLKQTADRYHLLFVPTVSPGYNERKKEPATGGLRRHRSGGQYFGVAWRTAIALAPPFITVASYNDWPAGTQIEEAIPYGGHRDYQPTGPRKYLDLTKHWVEQYVHSKLADVSSVQCDTFFNNTIC